MLQALAGNKEEIKNQMNKENFVRLTEPKNNKNRPSLLRGWLKGPIAQVLVLALIVASLPAPVKAQFQDKSGSLPGIISGKTVAIVGVAVGVGAGLLIFYLVKKKKGAPHVKLDTPPAKFTDVVAGQQAKEIVRVTNHMNDPVTVKAISVDDKTGALAIGDAKQVPFTLAPGEPFEIPVTVSSRDGEGKGRLRIVATTDKLKKDDVQFIDVSYGQQKSKLKKLIP
jgi:hypothetical protein